jgi:hypothetical protein
MDPTVIEQYTQPVPKIDPPAARSTDRIVDHTQTIQQLEQLVEQQDRRMRRLESELVELRAWIQRNSRP